MHYVPRNQAGTARHMSHDLTYMWNLKKKKKAGQVEILKSDDY